MIAFDLQCDNGHTFEGWFQDSAAYSEQKKKKLIACPICDSTEVTKLLSTFAIKSSPPTGDPRSLPVPPSPIPEGIDLSGIREQLSEFVEKNFDDVGCEFAKEALKIHYGVSEPRNIRGMSTREEEKTLKEEGIEFFKVPVAAGPKQETDS